MSYGPTCLLESQPMPTWHGQSRYVDAKYLATLLGVSESTIRNLSHRGQFPRHVTVGRLLRWNLSHVEDFLDIQQAP